MAVVSVALFFVSLTLHELGHAWVARRNGIEIAGIDLWFFGGIAKLSRDSDSPGEEFRVSAAGPAVTLLIVIVACVGGMLVGGTQRLRRRACSCATTRAPALAVLGWLALVNVGLFVFNLIPAFPLDGGRIATRDRVEAHRRPQPRRRASPRVSGQAFSYILMGLGIFLLVRGDAGSGIWWILMGWFLGQSATRRGRLEPLLRAPGGRDGGRRHGHPAGLGARRHHRAPGPGRVLPALPLAVVPGRRPDLRALPRAAAPATRVDGAVAGGPAGARASPTWSTPTATRPSASATTRRSSSSWAPRACAPSAR